MSKKFVRPTAIAVAASAFAVVAVGCTSTGSTSSSTSDWVGAGKDVTELKFATNVKSMGFDWFKRMAVGVDKFSADTGVQAFVQGPSQADAAQQAQVAQDQLSQGIDALVVVPIDVSSVEPVLKQAQDSGVVVVTHEASTVENANYDVEAFDNVAYGEHMMQELAKGMGEQGEYASFVGSLDSAAQNEWMDAAVAYQKTHYPNMTLVGDRQVTNSDQPTSYGQMKQLLQTYPQIKGVLGADSYDVVGAGQAVEEAGLSDQITVVGTSIKAYAGRLISSGAVDLISGWDPADTGYAANEVALRLLQGKTISAGDDLGVKGFESITLDGKVIKGNAWHDVDRSNVDTVDF
jgi:simple sugar transport system substrate-binding protein